MLVVVVGWGGDDVSFFSVLESISSQPTKTSSLCQVGTLSIQATSGFVMCPLPRHNLTISSTCPILNHHLYLLIKGKR